MLIVLPVLLLVLESLFSVMLVDFQTLLIVLLLPVLLMFLVRLLVVFLAIVLYILFVVVIPFLPVSSILLHKFGFAVEAVFAVVGFFVLHHVAVLLLDLLNHFCHHFQHLFLNHLLRFFQKYLYSHFDKLNYIFDLKFLYIHHNLV